MALVADYFARGRVRPGQRPPQSAGDEAFLNWMWGESLEPPQAIAYEAVSEQLYAALTDGQIPIYDWPMFVPTRTPDTATLEREVIRLDELKAWLERSLVADAAALINEIFRGTEPDAEQPNVCAVIRRKRGRPRKAPENLQPEADELIKKHWDETGEELSMNAICLRLAEKYGITPDTAKARFTEYNVTVALRNHQKRRGQK
ncbi:hypothetical protein BJI67_02175 [Acidihalobacter aeolianus]|uniref:Uncharacterized protein n=1 Tax=Acidihalobacter aeolianus TaxID=2792603 RepID=A0A1D8K524_9GAMM|nr:hypothetical protein BJI67_02175 [Acidihalobacter aeolianus]